MCICTYKLHNQTELSRNVKIWRSKHVEISSESETNIAEFVSVYLVSGLSVCCVCAAAASILLSCYWFVVFLHLESFSLLVEVQIVNCIVNFE